MMVLSGSLAGISGVSVTSLVERAHLEAFGCCLATVVAEAICFPKNFIRGPRLTRINALRSTCSQEEGVESILDIQTPFRLGLEPLKELLNRKFLFKKQFGPLRILETRSPSIELHFNTFLRKSKGALHLKSHRNCRKPELPKIPRPRPPGGSKK